MLVYSTLYNVDVHSVLLYTFPNTRIIATSMIIYSRLHDYRNSWAREPIVTSALHLAPRQKFNNYTRIWKQCRCIWVLSSVGKNISKLFYESPKKGNLFISFSKLFDLITVIFFSFRIIITRNVVQDSS